MKILSIILARLDSTRFPRKVLASVGGQVLICRVFNALRDANLPQHHIVLATTDRDIDDDLALFAMQNGIDIFRGDIVVAKRVYACLEKYNPLYFHRVNADSPIIDRELLAKGAKQTEFGYDLITNLYPRAYPYGISLELVKAQTFLAIKEKILDSSFFSEHITSYFYENFNELSICNIEYGHPSDHSCHLTIDTPEDLNKIVALFEKEPDIDELPPHEIAKIYRTIFTL